MVLGLDMLFCLGILLKIVLEEVRVKAKWCSGRFAPLGNAGVLRFAQNDERRGVAELQTKEQAQQEQRQQQIPSLRYGMTKKSYRMTKRLRNERVVSGAV